MRFTELSTILRKMATILTFPSAFTNDTGKAHWKVLLRARAIENQCYVITAAQYGHHIDKRVLFRQAMIVDPWGTILAECMKYRLDNKTNKRLAIATIDPNIIIKMRREMPVFKHRRSDVYELVSNPTKAPNNEEKPHYKFFNNIIPLSTVFYLSQLSFAFTSIGCIVPRHQFTSQANPSSGISIDISAPGKIILHGEHSVVYDKLAVAASLGLRTMLSLRESSSQLYLHFLALDLLQTYNFNDLQTIFLNTDLPLMEPLSNFSLETPELINHPELLQRIETYISTHALNPPQKQSVRVFLYLFAGIFSSTNVAIKPFSLKIASELSVSSGCGSSASFAVCIAAAFIQYIRRKHQQPNVSKSSYKATNLNCDNLNEFDDKELRLISQWAYSAEKITHGHPSGIDNTICTFGSVFTFRKSTGHRLLQLGEFQLLLVNTYIKRDTKRQVAHVRSLKEVYPKIVGLILNTLNEVSYSAIEILKELNELSKTDEFKSKLLYDKLGEVIDINQHLLQALGVSHASLDLICSICKKRGISSKLTGAGGGGYAMAVITPYILPETIEELISELKLQGFDTILTTLGGAGVTID